MIITAVGALVEYLFTRERVTEEGAIAADTAEKKPAVSVSQQMKICLKDRYWYIIIALFFFFQLGGMMKNVSQLEVVPIGEK